MGTAGTTKNPLGATDLHAVLIKGGILCCAVLDLIVQLGQQRLRQPPQHHLRQIATSAGQHQKGALHGAAAPATALAPAAAASPPSTQPGPPHIKLALAPIRAQTLAAPPPVAPLVVCS